MAEFSGRDLHLVKKALAIAVLAIGNCSGGWPKGLARSGGG
jgi:hypothetical protein